MENSEHEDVSHDRAITNAKLVFAQHGRADSFDSHVILIIIFLTNLYIFIYIRVTNIVLLSAKFQRSISQPARHTEKQQLTYNRKQVSIQ